MSAIEGETSCAEADKMNKKLSNITAIRVLNKCRWVCVIVPLVTFFAFFSAQPSFAHELWIDGQNFQAQSDETIRLDLRNGENFKGSAQAYFKSRVKSFYWSLNQTTYQVEARMGDIPAFSATPGEDGLMVVVYESTPSSLTYRDWAKFDAFIQHKDLGPIEEMHEARGLLKTDVKEAYHRYSKAVIGIGAAQGADQRFGLETEFVLLGNPYRDDPAQGLAVQILYRDAPRADAQIEIFERASDGTVKVSLMRSNAEGVAVIDIKPGHTYLLDAVLLRVPDPNTANGPPAHWESLWAAVTFAVPEG
jgi:cobalt/nickel transport protein